MKHKEKHSAMVQAFHKGMKEKLKKQEEHELYHAPKVKSSGVYSNHPELVQEDMEFNLMNEDRRAPSNLPQEGRIVRIPNFGQPPVHAAPYGNMFVAHVGNNEYDVSGDL